MLIPKGQKRGRIDKSVLAFGEPERIRDRAYLDTAQNEACLCCGARDGTVVMAHMRWDSLSGVSLKPSDDEVAPLCFRCHAEQERHSGPEWWANLLRIIRKRAYLAWTMQQKGQSK